MWKYLEPRENMINVGNREQFCVAFSTKVVRVEEGRGERW